MKYRPLGKTGLEVSVIGFGASPLGSVFGPIDEDDAIRSVAHALDLGINIIDVSPFYGSTKAEQVLGKVLATIPRPRYILSTKVGRYGQNHFDFSADRVRQSVDESLSRLHVDHVDIIQCHDIEFASLDQIINETLPALRQVVAVGKARFIGVTGLPLKVLTHVASRFPVDVVLSYCHYCLNDTSLADCLADFQRAGLGIMNASPLAMGLLTQQGPPAWHPAPPPLRQACARAAQICEQGGVDIASVAMQFAVAEPRIATTFVGMASSDHVVENVRWACQARNEEIFAKVRSVLVPVNNISWPSGCPENNKQA